jgi:phytanoyl-CoA hydroxylase
MVTEAQWREYDEQGFLRLGQVASDALLAAMQERIDQIMLGQVVYDGLFFQADSETGSYTDLTGHGWVGPTLNYRKIQELEKDPLFLEYMQLPLFHELSRRLIGEEVSVFRAMFMNKPAKRGTVLPYHQDGGTQWSLDRERFFTVWTALDQATVENGCVEVVPGTHQLGLLSEVGHTITPEQEAAHARDGQGVFLEAKAGEAILLHNYLLHRSGVNTIERPRRAFSVVYMDGATRSTRTGEAFPKVFGEDALRPGWTQPVET